MPLLSLPFSTSITVSYSVPSSTIYSLFQGLIFATWRGKVMKFKNILHDDLAGHFHQKKLKHISVVQLCTSIIVI